MYLLCLWRVSGHCNMDGDRWHLITRLTGQIQWPPSISFVENAFNRRKEPENSTFHSEGGPLFNRPEKKIGIFNADPIGFLTIIADFSRLNIANRSTMVSKCSPQCLQQSSFFSFVKQRRRSSPIASDWRKMAEEVATVFFCFHLFRTGSCECGTKASRSPRMSNFYVLHYFIEWPFQPLNMVNFHGRCDSARQLLIIDGEICFFFQFLPYFSYTQSLNGVIDATAPFKMDDIYLGAI